MGYQPRRVNGVDVGGQRVCSDRYEAIRDQLKGTPEPFTVLDLGANLGYFSQRLTEDFDCYVTAVDSEPGLLEAQSDRIEVIPQRFGLKELRSLERYDVVLALSVLHHFADWQQVLAELRHCRRVCFLEVPHPSENWMKYAKARHELAALHQAVNNVASSRIADFPRRGRNGIEYQRPMFKMSGNLYCYQGKVFSGRGSNSKSLTNFADETLASLLGYEPYPGSLNMNVGSLNGLSEAPLKWQRKVGGSRRAYDIWPAWLNDLPCHVIIPTAKKAHKNCLEGWAPVKLRNFFNLKDGDQVTIEVAPDA